MLTKAQQESLAGGAKFSRGEWALARDHFLEAIRLEPGCADYYFNAAMSCWYNADLGKAGEYLREAVRINPRLGRAQAWLGEWYLRQGMIEAARESTGEALKLEPDNPQFLSSRAFVLAAGDPDAAWEIARKLIARGPMNPSLAQLYGKLAGRFGEESKALGVIQGLLKSGPMVGQSSLQLTAAGLLDRMGRYDEAFALAAQANGSYRGTRYEAEIYEGLTQRLIEYFKPERMRSMPKASVRSDKPVFIVGMMRSGTSLVEQIVASHPAVHGAGELDFMYQAWVGLHRMLGADLAEYPWFLDRMTLEHVDGMADVYLRPLIAMNPWASRITDKMPINFLHLGLIRSLFPEARIIHCSRDAMDTCVSCFFTDFDYPHPLKHSLAHLGHFYGLYEKLMAHWRQVIDLPMLDVSYEKLVADPEGESRRLVKFLDLPWDDRCLKFHEQKRPCATASVIQVRQPIHGKSVGRWKHYEKHLGPLKAALGRDVS